MNPLHLHGARGGRLVADALGDPADPPVLLLHGGGQTRHAWTATSRALAEQGWYAVQVDARGHGDSDRDPEGRYHLNEFAADVRALTEQVPGAALIGASLGALASLLALGRDGASARAVVFVDIGVRLSADGVARIKRFMTAHPDGFASLDEAANAVAAYLPHRTRPDDTSGLQRNLRRGDDGRWRWHWDPRFLERRPDEPVYDWPTVLRSAAAGVQAPALVVRGGRSDVVTEADARELQAALPDAAYADVTGAHHMVAGDHNDAFSEAVLSFLAARR